MKLLIFTSLIMLVSCGKNTSGKPDAPAAPVPFPVTQPHSPDIPFDEPVLREEFLRHGSDVLRVYHDAIVAHRSIGVQGLTRMRAELKATRFLFSQGVLRNTHNNLPTRSISRPDRVRVLYVGEEMPHYSWRVRFNQRDKNLDRWVLHELLELVGIDDQNSRVSGQIIF